MHTSQFSQPRPPPPKRPWAAIGLVFVLVVVLANLVGYMLYRDRDRKPATEPVAAVEVPPVAPSKGEQDVSVTALAKEQRREGVKALRAGNYARAIANFEAALKLDPELEDVRTLKEVAERLQKSVPEDEEAAPPPPAPRPTVNRATRPKRRESRRVRERAAPPPPVVAARTDVEEPEPEPEPEPVAPSPPPPPPPPPPAKSASSELESDERLNLVALVDRNVVDDTVPRDTTEPARVEPAPTGREEAVRPSSGGSPRLVVFWPGRSSAALAGTLRPAMSGVDVVVTSEKASLRAALEGGADGLMASPSVLRTYGLSGAMTGASEDGGRYVVASLSNALTNDALRGMTVGIVDELGRRGMKSLVTKLLGGTSPRLRRVTKVEDLLPLLQFSIAGAVIVRQRDLEGLRSRTEQKLYTRVLSNHSEPLVVGFVEGGRRSVVERAVRSMSPAARSSLGVESWR